MNSMSKKYIQLIDDSSRTDAITLIRDCPISYVITVSPPTRSLEQNKLLWSCLEDVSNQIPWRVNGEQTYISPEEWKDIFTAAMNQELKIAEGIYGGVVLLGLRTSHFTKSELSDLINFIHAFGNERGVNWSKTSIGSGL